jgi:regulator of replication initiation timing
VMNKFKDEPVDSYNIVGRLVQENEALKHELRLLKDRVYNFITEKEWIEESKKKEQQG